MFKQKYHYYYDLAEQFLAQLPFEDNLICQSMNYTLSAGGKRIRPVLALACAEAVGGKPENIVREACALELIHTYSLIHDDLPAMDDDDLRRGKPSNHKVFGEAVAILAGDALLTYAFELLAQSSMFPPEKQLSVIKETAIAAGWRGMVGGQVLDTLGSAKNNALEDIENIHRKKTGALLVVSARLGAILGGGNEEQIKKLSGYASYLGLAFQIKDDILDGMGCREVMGKPAGSDSKLAKTTYWSLLGPVEAVNHLNSVIAQAKECLKDFGAETAFLLSLADYVAERSN
jgi:geranylgeranyl diphosphate synthase type II